VALAGVLFNQALDIRPTPMACAGTAADAAGCEDASVAASTRTVTQCHIDVQLACVTGFDHSNINLLGRCGSRKQPEPGNAVAGSTEVGGASRREQVDSLPNFGRLVTGQGQCGALRALAIIRNDHVHNRAVSTAFLPME
jgi:hypothetical protein